MAPVFGENFRVYTKHGFLPWIAVTLLAACSTPGQQPLTRGGEETSKNRVKRLIEKYESQGHESLATGITKYVFDGRNYWLIISPCCDMFNYLYNAEGQVLCAPSGGFTGQGDGRCPAGITPYRPTVSAPPRQ
ncbi:MAG: hypothetical protein HEQ37_19225 [Acidovorax sp.]|nr:hypothetical protein [Acidovorax sp.]